MTNNKIIVGIAIAVLLAIFLLTIRTTPVTFVNKVDGTLLGIAKFKMVSGKQVDYKLLKIQWSDKVKVLNLKPGYYGVTQYLPPFEHPKLGKVGGIIINYQEFWVKDKPLEIKF
ncbi:MAG: hypothetical protein PVG65_05230 [Candidatus Thorarchaeota archaeon]|jgi:hypothetical protein